MERDNVPNLLFEIRLSHSDKTRWACTTQYQRSNAIVPLSIDQQGQVQVLDRHRWSLLMLKSLSIDHFEDFQLESEHWLLDDHNFKSRICVVNVFVI